jgi:Predicted hydrolases or acyltransferases (alpha/beta hydrolase superfamily)
MEFFATANGIPIHISDTKEGEKSVVLLHGYLETLYIFSEFSELLSSAGYRVISIDLPGFGLSGSHPQINSMELCADVVFDVVQNICKVSSVIVIGHSMGGYVAQEFAIKYSSLVSKLILLDSSPFEDTEEKKIEREREISAILSSKLMVLASLSIPKMYSSNNIRKFDEKIEETIEICETHDPIGVVASIRGMMQRNNFLEGISKIQFPIIMIFGSDDIFLKSLKEEDIIAHAPNVKIVIIDGCGHNCFIEAPDKVLEAISLP